MKPCSNLVIDLDGTLLKSDILVETALVFLKTNPFRIFSLLIWLLTGKAELKNRLANKVDIDASLLPYNKEVLAWIKQEKQSGRKIILATASHQKFAQQIADHLQCFDEVLATSGAVNLSSTNKANLLSEKYGSQGFDYAGNSHDDLAVWQIANESIVVNASTKVLLKAKQKGNVTKQIENRGSIWSALLKALRLHQWLKNLLLFVPLAASHQIIDITLLAQAALAFFLFSICASSVYLLNDLLDLADDRQHPRKQKRPFANGNLDLRLGILLIPVMLVFVFICAVLYLPVNFIAALVLYYTLTLSYSLKLKRVVLVDVVMLAMLYTIRIIAGAMAVSSELTSWILAFSMFIFLSLALVKRYAELHDNRKNGEEVALGRGYRSSDLEMLSSLGAASGYISVLVLALYINQPSTANLYTYPELIWFACPLLLYWVSRVWLVAHRGFMHDDPILFAAKDRVSQIVGLLFVSTFWLAI